MLMKKIIFFTLPCLLFLSTISFSQSSVYQDAKDLAHNIQLQNLGVPVINLEKVKSGIDSLWYYDPSSGFGKDMVINDKFFKIENFGLFEFYLHKGDTTEVTYLDTILTITVSEDFEYPSQRLIIGNFHESFFIKISNGDDVIFYQKSPLYNVIHILRTHSEFRDISTNQYLSVPELQSTYSNNYFFRNALNGQPKMKLLAYDDLVYFDQGDLEASLSTDYSWNKYLYGDSIFQLERTVSYKDVVKNYRTPITTSNDILETENKKLNNQKKKGSFLDAKTVAVGLSDFIAERAQEELNLTFFNRFKENLREPSELTILFPNTRDLLFQFEISDYKTLLSHARESFVVDLDNLGLNFPEILKLKKYKHLYNSPEVFNMGLIYSISNLAYKEIPVDEILIHAYQQLNAREEELDKDINVTIARNILSKKKNPNSEFNIPLGSEIPAIQKMLERYFRDLEGSKTSLSYLVRLVYKEHEKKWLLKALSADPDDKDLQRSIEKIDERLQKLDGNMQLHVDGKLGDAFFRKINSNGRTINERNLFRFYSNTIFPNLEGKEYYGDLLESFDSEDMSNFLQSELDSTHNIMARGIAGTRNLLDERFEDAFLDFLRKLEDVSKQHRALRGDMLVLFDKSDRKEKLEEVAKKKNHRLKNMIDEEYYFWKEVANLKEDDHDLMGFHLLRSSLDEPGKFEYFLSQFEGGIKYPVLVFDKIVKKLVKKYGDLPFDKNMYENKLATFERLVEQFEEIDEKIRNAKLNLEKEKNEVVEQRINEISERLTEILRIKQISTGEEVMSLDSEFKELSDERGNLESNLNIIKLDKINELIQKYIEEFELTTEGKEYFFPEKFKQSTWEYWGDSTKTKAFSFGIKTHLKEKVADQYTYQPSASTTGKLKDFYKLRDSHSLKKYRELDDEVTLINQGNFKILDELDWRIDSAKNEIHEMLLGRKELVEYLDQLEKHHCENLVEAKDNAKNLGKSLELATHMLYAFQDVKSQTEQLSYFDTSNVVITKNILDPNGNIIGSSKLDTINVVEKIIPESVNSNNGSKWISKEDFEKLKNNELEWNLFLGLLEQRLKSVEDPPGFSADGIALLATKFLSITHDIESHKKALRLKKAKKETIVNFKDYYPFIRTTVDLFNTIITTPTIHHKSLADKFPSLAKVPVISNQALSLYENIYIKEYGNAILNAMELLELITETQVKSIDKSLPKKEQRRLRKRATNTQLAINGIMRYGTFMANMVNAQTSDQVKNILHSTTLPPGSSRIKREVTSSFTINSYLGGTIGRDVLQDAPPGFNRTSFGAALSVPVGFTYSFSPKFLKSNSSFSVFVPLLDLGAITAYRSNPAKDDPTYNIDELPEIKWENLFSPGGFLVYNFKNSPFSLGLGGQYGPQLRKIEVANAEPVITNSFRFPMLFIDIDVPLFNLHTGARKIIVN